MAIISRFAFTVLASVIFGTIFKDRRLPSRTRPSPTPVKFYPVCPQKLSSVDVMMIQKYTLIEDGGRNEWRLLKQGASYVESIFLTLDDAIIKLPDAVGNIAAIVEIRDGSGAICGKHFLQANRKYRSSP